MIKRFVLIALISIIYFSCREVKSDNVTNYSKVTIQDSIQNKQKNDLVINKEMLIGVWGENEHGNALFEIDSDSIRYVEFYETPYTYDLNSGLNIHLDGYISKNKIIKLTQDSLIIESSMEEVIRLKRRDSN